MVPYKPHILVYLFPSNENESKYPMFDYPIWDTAGRVIHGMISKKIPSATIMKSVVALRNPAIFRFDISDLDVNNKPVIAGGKFRFGNKVYYITANPEIIDHGLELDHVKVLLDELDYPHTNDRTPISL